MFSVIFPGQGSQSVGMGKEFYDKYDLVKSLFKEADEALDTPLSKIILDGPKEELDLTANTQPAIFLISYSIFQVIKQEFNIDLTKAKFFAVPRSRVRLRLFFSIRSPRRFAAPTASTRARSVSITARKRIANACPLALALIGNHPTINRFGSVRSFARVPCWRRRGRRWTPFGS